jgi:isoquinoline 1-oxidoreductase
MAELNRREWIGLLGAGVTFRIVVDAAGGEQLGARLHIAPDGRVALYTGKVEAGQGCRTLLTQCVAEEMRVDPSKVRVVTADTALTPDDGGTYGSLTTPLTVPVVRRAAAAARELLAAMKPEEAMQQEIPVKVSLTPPAEWKVLASSLANVSGREIVTGALRYASDVKLPGMLVGKVVRPDAHHAELVSYDAGEAERMPGVKVVREGDFLGVVAPDALTAGNAAAAVRAEWRTKDLVEPPALFEFFKKTAVAPEPGPGTRYPPLLEKGSVTAALAEAAKRHQAAYTLPYIAHVPMEPRAAVASWDGRGLTVHCGTSVPFGVRKQLAAAFGIAEIEVRVIVPDFGGGFGGKHGPEVALEAARLARAAGKPVRVCWSRSEEFVRSYCRPAGLIEVRSGLAPDGKIVAWDFHNYNSGPASLAVPYAIPNFRCGYHRAESPLRQGSYRSLAAVANAFARETHVEELSALAGLDPVEFRLRNLADARMREVIERAAERFGWGKGASASGMACNLEKGSYISLFVELDPARDRLRPRRMVAAFDCGAVLNPDNLRNQIAGCLIMGLGGALFEELRYDRRNIVNDRLSAYRVPRFTDVPSIEIVLVDRRDTTPAGAGETPITAVAPAIGAAFFRATGKRLRAMPLAKGIS